MIDEALDLVNEIKQLGTRTVLVPTQDVLFGGIQLGQQTIPLRAGQLCVRRDACSQVVKGLQGSLDCHREAA